VGLLGGFVAGGVFVYNTNTNTNSQPLDEHLEEQEVHSKDATPEKTVAELDEKQEFEHPMKKLPWYMQFLYKLKRTIFLACLFMPCTAVSFAAYITNDERVKDYLLELLLRTMETAGCTFQKYGQWISNRPDMFPESLVNTMKRLCTDSPAHSAKRTRETFKQSFGVEIEEIFDEFDMTPVASGSVAQVYRAKLKPEYALEDGTVEVAVKVRHPNVMLETFFDVDILYHFINFGSYFTSVFSVPFDRTAFASLLQKQVDLTYEAYNLRKFNRNFASETASGSLNFPRFSEELLSPSVLVEGWAKGEVLLDLFNVSKDAVENARDKIETFTQSLGDQFDETKRDMAATIFDTAMKMCLRDNLVHGDLHGGNVMYNTETDSMTVIDAGIACTLDEQDGLTQFIQFLQAMCEGSADKVSRTVLNLSHVPATLDREAFDAEISHAIDMFMDPDTRQSKTGEGPVLVGDITGEVFRTLQRHQVYLAGDVISLLLSVAMLEGMLIQLDPEFSMLDRALPYIARYRFDVVTSLR